MLKILFFIFSLVVAVLYFIWMWYEIKNTPTFDEDKNRFYIVNKDGKREYL